MQMSYTIKELKGRADTDLAVADIYSMIGILKPCPFVLKAAYKFSVIYDNWRGVFPNIVINVSSYSSADVFAFTR